MKKTLAISNPTIDTINTRRAVRKYKEGMPDQDMIVQLLDAGMMAPSAMNKQPWKFYVLRDKALIKSIAKEIAEVAFKDFNKPGLKGIFHAAKQLLHVAHDFNFHLLHDPVFHGAPVVVFITAPKDNEWAPIDIGMCAQNIMLCAKSLGLDSCPVGFGKFVSHTSYYSKLGIPDNEMVLLSITLGYGDEQPEAHKRETDKIVFVQ
jgi:nitroreductase